MANANLNRRTAVAAAIAAGLLILVLGLVYRILGAQLLTPVSTIPIDANALERLSMQIGDWTGEDVPLDGDVMRILGAEASINRQYSCGSGLESISLFIIAKGVTLGLVGDAPEICNVAAGNTLTDQRSVQLWLGDGTKLPCRILEFSRSGSLAPESKTVLYYYMADSHFCGDRPALRSRVRRGPSIVNCVAQVQIVASSTAGQPADSATRLVSDFAVDSAPEIARLFKNLEKELSSGNSGTACEER